MPLNLSNRDQNSGHLFYNRRLRAAITRFSVRMKHDDRKQQAAVALSMVLVLLGVGWMALLHFMKPSGLVGESAIIGDRDTGPFARKRQRRRAADAAAAAGDQSRLAIEQSRHIYLLGCVSSHRLVTRLA